MKELYNFFQAQEEATVLDYSPNIITDKQFQSLLNALDRNKVLELNLLETGITPEQVHLLHEKIMRTTNLVTLKLQTYDNHPKETKAAINEMEKHVKANQLAFKNTQPLQI